jgi:hypothetical protein
VIVNVDCRVCKAVATFEGADFALVRGRVAAFLAEHRRCFPTDAPARLDVVGVRKPKTWEPHQ